jgi:SAM-dependent methyltransferase
MTREVRNVSALEGYDLWGATYDATPNPVVRMDARHAVRILEPQPGEHILDAGCGTGRHLGALTAAGARAIGIDFSAGMLAAAHVREPSTPLARVDLQRALPFADATFDAVLCAFVAEHLADLGLPLREQRRVLRPGGRLVLTVYHPTLAAAGAEPNFDLGGLNYRLGTTLRSVQEYLDLVVEAGFAQLAFAEYRGDQRLADEVPGAARLVGLPVLLLVAAAA